MALKKQGYIICSHFEYIIFMCWLATRMRENTSYNNRKYLRPQSRICVFQFPFPSARYVRQVSLAFSACDAANVSCEQIGSLVQFISICHLSLPVPLFARYSYFCYWHWSHRWIRTLDAIQILMQITGTYDINILAFWCVMTSQRNDSNDFTHICKLSHVCRAN